MAKQVAHRLKDRFIGQEQELLQSIRIHGSISTMIRYGVSDYICWTKYIDKLRLQFARDDSPGEISSPADKQKENSNSLIPDNKDFLGICPNRKELADELINAFTDKVVYLKTENDRLYARIQELENKLAILEDKNDDRLASSVIQAIEVIKRC